jgi:hypothetical protein
MGREVFGSETVLETKPAFNWKCSAYGCNLPGGLSPGFGQDARYYCRFHYGKEPFENDSITRILRGYSQIFDAIYAIREIESIQKIGLFMKSINRPDLMPQTEELLLPHYYRMRLLKEIGQEIQKEIQAHKEALAA